MAATDGFDTACPGLLRLAYRVAYRVLGVREEAEDVGAETLARALARRQRLADDPEPWVVTVAARLALDVVRRRRTSRHHASAAVREPSVDADHQQGLVVQQALLKLPRRQREVGCWATWPTAPRSRPPPRSGCRAAPSRRTPPAPSPRSGSP